MCTVTRSPTVERCPRSSVAASRSIRTALAVRADGRSITYRELDTASTRLARALIARGAGPDSIVALAFPRSYEMVLSVWAVAKSGAAHLPVDPS